MMTDSHFIDHLAESLRYNADWRCAKLKEFPSDYRNAHAISKSNRMALELETGSFDASLADAYASLCRSDATLLERAKVELELVAGIGFRSHFSSADEFLKNIVEQVSMRCDLEREADEQAAD